MSYLPYKQAFAFIYLVVYAHFARLHVHPSKCVEVRGKTMENGAGD